MMNSVPDYWVCDAPKKHDVNGWFGVVDESKGGIVAYFQTEELANQFVSQVVFNSFTEE